MSIISSWRYATTFYCRFFFNRKLLTGGVHEKVSNGKAAGTVEPKRHYTHVDMLNPSEHGSCQLSMYLLSSFSSNTSYLSIITTADVLDKGRMLT